MRLPACSVSAVLTSCDCSTYGSATGGSRMVPWTRRCVTSSTPKALADEALVPRLTAQLRSQLVSMRPLPLTAAGVQVLSRGGRSVVKWHVPLTREMQRIEETVDDVVQAHKGLCRYLRSAGRPGVTALRDIQDLDREPGLTGLIFPCHLFTAQAVQVSRQISPQEFAILDSFLLGEEPRPMKMDQPEGGVPA